jgi:hypothetical protein
MKKMKVATLATVMAFSLTSCATMSSDDTCNPFVAGAAGAAIGGAAGAIVGGNKKWRSAAIGAAIGAAAGTTACLVINSTSKQTQSANQVESEYLKRNRGQLPETPTLISYSASVFPQDAISPGDDLTITSNVKVVKGRQEPIHEIKERITLFAADGRTLSSHEKQIGGANPDSGAYENTFSVTMPESAPLGDYTFRTQIFVNNYATRPIDNQIQLVMLGNNLTFAMVKPQ